MSLIAFAGFFLVRFNSEHIGKPTRLRAGSEADRQLNLADLLSTALSLRASPALFASAVLAQADARVSALHPAVVKVAWLGRRAWGVIASLIAMAVLLTSLSALGRSEGQAQQHSRAGASAIPAARGDTVYAPGDRGPARAFGTDHPTGADENDRNVVEADPAGAANRTAAGNANASDNTGNGGGAGMARGNPTQHSPTQNNTNGGTRNPEGTGESALGSGATGTGDRATTGGNSGSAGPAAGHRVAPAWASAAWPGGRDAAQQAVRDGRISGDYAALVRAYFDR